MNAEAWRTRNYKQNSYHSSPRVLRFAVTIVSYAISEEIGADVLMGDSFAFVPFHLVENLEALNARPPRPFAYE